MPGAPSTPWTANVTQQRYVEQLGGSDNCGGGGRDSALFLRQPQEESGGRGEVL